MFAKLFNEPKSVRNVFLKLLRQHRVFIFCLSLSLKNVKQHTSIHELLCIMFVNAFLCFSHVHDKGAYCSPQTSTWTKVFNEVAMALLEV